MKGAEDTEAYFRGLLEQTDRGSRPAELLLRHCVCFDKAIKPSWLPIGEPKQCYMDAAECRPDNPSMFYAEGLAMNGERKMPRFKHAWWLKDG